MSSIYVGLLNVYMVQKLYTGHAKCILIQNKLEYLGHIIGGGIIAGYPVKMRAIMDWLELMYIKHI